MGRTLPEPSEAPASWLRPTLTQAGAWAPWFRLPTENLSCRTHALGGLPFCFSGFPNIVPSENPTGAEERNFSPHGSSGTMWCRGKVLPLTSTCAQQLCTQAQGTASQGQPREVLQPRSTAPTPTILNPLTQARDRPAVITQGLLVENMVLFWGRPMFPSQPPCLSLHLCLSCLPVCILGSSSPSLLS